MLDGLRTRVRQGLRRARRLERHEQGEIRAWLETTRNLVHLSVLVFLPLLIGLVTYLSNTVEVLPYLLFPPLAAGTYTLFAHPESKYASPRRFVGGLSTGALCGWIALEVTARYYYGVPPEAFAVHPGAAAFGVFLTGVVTWGLDIEESSAYSTALLVLVTGVTQLVYVASVVVSTSLIAVVFLVWRRGFYERRAEYLYQSTKGNDHVLVPMRGSRDDATGMLAGRIAAAHDAGTVVLLDIVDDGEVAAAERARLDDPRDAPSTAATAPDDPDSQADRGRAAAVELERRGDRIEEALDVPCEAVVAVRSADPARTVLRAAREFNCDLIAVPFEAGNGQLSPFVRGLLGGDVDVLVHRSVAGETEWTRPLVSVRRAGDVAHAMIDFARRLTPTGSISVCHSIASGRDRRSAESMLADLVETVTGEVETRVVNQPVEDFLGRAAASHDIIFLGASTDRSAASRFLARPTFHRLPALQCDVAIVHRG